MTCPISHSYGILQKMDVVEYNPISALPFLWSCQGAGAFWKTVTPHLCFCVARGSIFCPAVGLKLGLTSWLIQ